MLTTKRKSAVAVLMLVTLQVKMSILWETDLFQRGEATNKSTRSMTTRESIPELRFDWTRLEILHPFAQKIYQHQRNCDLVFFNYWHRYEVGLGSDLHVWSKGLCMGLEEGYRIRSRMPWIWRDANACGDGDSNNNSSTASPSSMQCYFPESEFACPGDRALVEADLTANTIRNITQPHLHLKEKCSRIQEVAGGITNFRTAATVYLFSRVSPILQLEAERQMRVLFAGRATAPPGLITVNIRWGDKKAEMKLVPATHYVDAVHTILQKRRDSNTDDVSLDSKANQTIHILLATEDPRAVQEFRDAAPSNWRIYIDVYHTEMLPTRKNGFNGNPKMAKKLGGRPGIIALGSLLVAMEADAFVLTTKSNWSRLMNELRKGVLDPRCGNCTIMIDLSPGEN